MGFFRGVPVKRPFALVGLSLVCAAPAPAQFKDLWVRMVNPEIDVALKHPPTLGLKLQRIGFMPAADGQTQDLIAACTMDLTAKGELEVVDRANLEAILKEQKLGMTGYFDPETITRMGKLLGAQALLTVKVGHYKSENVHLKEDRSYTDKEGRYHTLVTYISRAKVDMVATVGVTDLVTGKVFMTQRVVASPHLDNTSDRGYPDFPSELQVRELAMTRARTEVRRMLLPWTEPRRLVFFDDKDYGMKEAYQALKLNDPDRALARSKDAIEKAKADPKAKPKYLGRVNYNQGICLFILGFVDEAVPYLQAAREVDPNSNVYKQSLDDCQLAIKLREDNQKVDQRTAEQRRSEQMAEAPPVAPPPPPVAPKGAQRETSKAAPEKGAKGDSPEAKLERLLQMKKKGLIDEQEFKQKKAEILKDM